MSEEPEIQLPVAVIVGRPNVGKSTLFNRVIGEQAAIVEDRPGVTRDRKELEANWLGHRFMLVDTGGWMPGGSELDAKVSRQVEAAVRNADLVIACTPNSPRAVPAVDVAAVVRAMGVMVEQIDDVPTAVQRAIDVSTEDDVILVAGSLYVAGAARTAAEDIARRGD